MYCTLLCVHNTALSRILCQMKREEQKPSLLMRWRRHDDRFSFFSPANLVNKTAPGILYSWKAEKESSSILWLGKTREKKVAIFVPNEQRSAQKSICIISCQELGSDIQGCKKRSELSVRNSGNRWWKWGYISSQLYFFCSFQFSEKGWKRSAYTFSSWFQAFTKHDELKKKED